MNNFKNYIAKNILLILLVFIPLFLFLLISVVFTDNSNVWIFPFSVEIWGSVSDWFMVWVTGITAIYLIKTFKEQQRLTQIENFNYKERIKPKFEIDAGFERSNSKHIDKDTFFALVFISIYVRNSNAYNVIINFEKDLNLINKHYDIIYENNYVYISDIKIPIKIEDLGDRQEQLSSEIKGNKFFYYNSIKIKFTDSENTPYSQQIKFQFHNFENIIAEFGPVTRI